MVFRLTDNTNLDRDSDGEVLFIEHVQQPFVAVTDRSALDEVDGTAFATTPQMLAEQYLREVAPIYHIDGAMLPGSSDFAGGERDIGGGDRLELDDQKVVIGTTVISYQQTHDQLPVWGAGFSLTIQPEPMRVTASQSSVHRSVSTSSVDPAAAYRPEAITPDALAQILFTKDMLSINATPRFLVYEYDPGNRFDPESRQPDSTTLQEPVPTLALPDVPDAFVAGQHYVVTEVLFTLAVSGIGDVNWRAFVEPETGAVLYLRAFIACATGMIFRTDPATAGAAATVVPTAPAAALNPFRDSVVLEGLANADPQNLSGVFVRVVDIQPPVFPPPSQTNPPANFAYDAPGREFAAVNAYHHCDWLFRQMHLMGFNLSTYFDGTSFPVPVDASAFSDAVNARAPGNTTGTGSGGFQFGLAGSPFPAVSIAADVRVVLHEFGHALLWDSVHSPNFGFAHSAGDSLAAVLLDPASALRTDAVRRFETFPWIIPNRNHGRDVTAGWAWGGVNDVGSYSSEQILSTTHFRLYRSLGGDAADLAQRLLAARQTAYLIIRAIGSLASNPVTPTPTPDIYATSLMNADIGTVDFEGYRGGAFHKVIRWSFEKQGLYQPAGAPRPVVTPGAPPAVDVFIDDGRAGEYQFQPNHWECTNIWNRLTPTAGTHETPVVGQTNYAYVRVSNRGMNAATNVRVRGYSAQPGAGLSWPDDWLPMDTIELPVPGGVPAGGAVVVGPFHWRPRTVGHECMFMEVSADGDLSNIDAGTFYPCAIGPTAEWRIVPFDNNLAQRNVAPVPGGGGVRGLLAGFVQRRFDVHNPYDSRKRFVVKGELPEFLRDRGWRIRVGHRYGCTSFGLAAGAQRQISVSLRPGCGFTADDVAHAGEPVLIRVRVLADDVVVGGMTYELDPNLDCAPRERVDDDLIPLDHPAIEQAIRDAEEHGMVVEE
ncbi:hypothetical protein LFM09_42670 [Lentzea alba]|uniref:hypothetical protein n=1 Tax=Lentzea alba TaxID=2714351 RepID=UPI0039BEFE41